MALVYADRVKEYSANEGTANMVLTGAAVGYRTFAAALAQNDTLYYCIDDNKGNWEIGLGTWDEANLTLNRNASPVSSSNAGAAVAFGVGTKEVCVTFPAASIIPANSGNIAFLTGKGIDFSNNANCATANCTTTKETLDWYEEGTWTPVVGGNTTVGTPTTTAASGQFIRIGNLCFINFAVIWSAHTGSSGTLTVWGLPYTNISTITVIALQPSSVAFGVGTPTAVVAGSANKININLAANGAATSGVAVVASGELRGSGCYRVA